MPLVSKMKSLPAIYIGNVLTLKIKKDSEGFITKGPEFIVYS